MKLFYIWVISVLTDWVGFFVLFLLLFDYADFLKLIRGLHEENNYTMEFSAIIAFIPAFLSALYAAKNYRLILSWVMIRRMSPLNIFTGQISHFIKTFIMSGAACTAILFFLITVLFPNMHFEWVMPLINNCYELFCKYILHR